MSKDSSLTQLTIGDDMPAFKSIDDLLKDSKKITESEAKEQGAEGRKLVNYITENQLMQILSQRAVITNVKK